MRSITFRAMTAAILVIAIICATGLASAMLPIGVQPTQPPVIQPPTVTPTPTRTPIVGPTIVVEPPVVAPPGSATPTPTATPTVTPTPTATVTPTQTQTPTTAPTVTPMQPQTPTVAPAEQPQSQMVMQMRPSPPTVAVPQASTMQPRQNVSAGAEMEVLSGPGDNMYPAISGNSVVWVNNDSANESFSVQLYNASSDNITTLSNATSVPLAMPYQLDIGESDAVWSGMNPQIGDSVIYLNDTASGTLQQVTEDGPGMQLDPGVSQGYIIWTNLTNESSDVYLYEIASENITPLVAPLSYRTDTAIGGNTTAWADNNTSNGDFDIVVAPLGESEGTVLGGPGDDRYPDVSSDGRYVAWISFLENRSAVDLYDVAENNTTQITGESALPDSVAVDGNLVVYSDLRTGNHDIYLYNITTGMETPVTQDPYDQSYPDVSNGEIVWMGNNTGRWEIYHASAGGSGGIGVLR